VWWVNEEVQVLRAYAPIQRDRWKQALANTKGISGADWREELEELEWRRSESWRPGPRPRKHKRRVAMPPDPPVPHFARRSGAIPRAGAPEIDRIKLPPGRRYPRGLAAAYWASDEPVPEVEPRVQRLVSAFADTGLWPLLWRFDEDPDDYVGGHGDLDAIDKVDATEVLQTGWANIGATTAATEPFTDFPGLAPSTGYRPEPDRTLPTRGDSDDQPARLLIVPCNRPADAITALGGLACEVEAPLISAVLRSWEQRFGASVFEVAPSALTVAVAAPPTTMPQALRLAAEHMAFCPPATAAEPGALRELARRLLHGMAHGSHDATGWDRWDVRWPD
jgi:hypothetical protein